MKRREAGFTLLEVMIAVGIFALLGLGTYRMLDTVLRTDEATRQQERNLRELTRAFATLDRDLSQATARPIRDPYGDGRAALLGELGASDGRAAVELTRGGWRNPLGLTRSQLQRVRWRLAGEDLERVYWTVLDAAVDSQPRVQKVLGGVTSLEFRYLDERGTWHEQWPLTEGEGSEEEKLAALPVALEIKLEQRRFGALTRLYRLPENYRDTPQPKGSPAKGEGQEGVGDGTKDSAK